MRSLTFGLIIYFFLSLSCNGSISATQTQVQYPKLTFVYDWRSWFIDTIGSLYYGNAVTNEHQKQLEQQLPELIAAWERDAPILFGEVFSFFGRGFSAKERTAIIYLCNGYSYGSQRFLIFGLRYYLNPEPWLASTSREDTFSSLVLHELLHVWVDENINKNNSPMLTKYCNEDADVLDHLHLMAIQKMVYLKINRPDMLAMIDESYRKLQGTSYCRAWEIVNDIEGHEALLRDIMINFNEQKSGTWHC